MAVKRVAKPCFEQQRNCFEVNCIEVNCIEVNCIEARRQSDVRQGDVGKGDVSRGAASQGAAKAGLRFAWHGKGTVRHRNASFCAAEQRKGIALIGLAWQRQRIVGRC